MNAIEFFSNKGLQVNLAGENNLKIQGLSALPEDLKSDVIKYTKQHKWRIILELKSGIFIDDKIDILWKMAEELSDWIGESDAPYQERISRLPELEDMKIEIDRLLCKKQELSKLAYQTTRKFIDNNYGLKS